MALKTLVFGRREGMKFKEHHYYKHKAFRDVCIKVIKVSFACEDYVKMKADYINLGCTGNPMHILRKNNYVITANDYENWVWLSEEEVKIPRCKPRLEIENE